MAAVHQAAMVDEVVPVDDADCYDDMRADAAHSDVRYDICVMDDVAADGAPQAAMGDGMVPADVVVAELMHTNLLTDINIRICIFS